MNCVFRVEGLRVKQEVKVFIDTVLGMNDLRSTGTKWIQFSKLASSGLHMRRKQIEQVTKAKLRFPRTRNFDYFVFKLLTLKSS